MRIALIGPGSVGGLLASNLTQSGHTVTLVDHRPKRAKVLHEAGWTVTGPRGVQHVQVPVVCDGASLPTPELTCLCVKATQTQDAIRLHADLLRRSDCLLSLQNGIDNAVELAEAFDPERVFAGMLTFGVFPSELGHLQHGGTGGVVLGRWPIGPESEARLVALAEVFRGAGFPADLSGDIRRVLWKKLLVNAVINPLSAILQKRNGEILSQPGMLEVAEHILEEGISAARSAGVEIGLSEARAALEEVTRLTSENRSSTWVDVAAGRATEIDALNGAIARRGDYPLNRLLTALVQALPPRLTSMG